MVLIQIPHPIQARFKLPNPPKAEKKNLFGLLKLNKKLGICLIPTNLMT